MLEGHPCLWNIYEKCYHFREAQEKGFQEILRALNISVADIKAEITSLHVQLGLELAKIRATIWPRFKQLNKSSWIFWESLEFLHWLLFSMRGKVRPTFAMETKIKMRLKMKWSSLGKTRFLNKLQFPRRPWKENAVKQKK